MSNTAEGRYSQVIGVNSIAWLDYQTVIGDDIRQGDLSNCISVHNDRLIIGHTLFGQKTNIPEIIKSCNKKYVKYQTDIP